MLLSSKMRRPLAISGVVALSLSAVACSLLFDLGSQPVDPPDAADAQSLDGPVVDGPTDAALDVRIFPGCATADATFCDDFDKKSTPSDFWFPVGDASGVSFTFDDASASPPRSLRVTTTPNAKLGYLNKPITITPTSEVRVSFDVLTYYYGGVAYDEVDLFRLVWTANFSCDAGPTPYGFYLVHDQTQNGFALQETRCALKYHPFAGLSSDGWHHVEIDLVLIPAPRIHLSVDEVVYEGAVPPPPNSSVSLQIGFFPTAVDSGTRMSFDNVMAWVK